MNVVKQYWAPALAVLGVLALTAFVVWYPQWIREWFTDRKDIIAAAVVVVLAMITSVYVYHTHGIQLATKRQAEATAQQSQATLAMLTEVRKQRQLSTQPWVFPALFLEQETSGLGGALYEEAPPSLVSFRNLGNGAAISVEVTVSEESTVPSKAMILVIQEAWKRRQLGVTQKRSGPTWPFIDRGQRVLWENAFESPKEGETGIILVEYRDIYGTEFLSGWAYRFARVQGERLALTPGEPLYPVSRS